MTDPENIILNTRGRIFSVRFKKRGGGERHMIARTGVKKFLRGGSPAYDPSAHELVWVYDLQKNGYRSIPLEGITQIQCGKLTYHLNKGA